MVEILPITIVPITAVCVIIGTLLIAYAKKWMMTYALIIANFIVFILSVIFRLQIIGAGPNFFEQFPGLGFRPIYLQPTYSPQLYTLFTSMFVHGGFLHIFGNMLVFFFIGMAFEQRVGWKNFLVIYLLSGICGTITHSLLNLGDKITLIGASGAIFGIMGAFAFSYPRDEVVMPIPLGIIMILRRVKVIYAVLLFAALETIIVWWESLAGTQSQTAHFAHLGGLASGVVLSVLLIKNRRTTSRARDDTIYYDSYASQRPQRINFSNLKKLAITDEQKSLLENIKDENVPQVREVWLEHYLEKARCPRCRSQLNHFHKKIWCNQCGYKTSY
jgi:membrane associated rhomboid family serine protease